MQYNTEIQNLIFYGLIIITLIALAWIEHKQNKIKDELSDLKERFARIEGKLDPYK